MFKKLLTIVCLIVASVTSVVGQHMPGSWRLVPMSGVLFSQVIDTQHKVYYLTGMPANGSVMYSYDKDSKETKYYIPGTDVSGSKINRIYYNSDKNYLVITR